MGGEQYCLFCLVNVDYNHLTRDFKMSERIKFKIKIGGRRRNSEQVYLEGEGIECGVMIAHALPVIGIRTTLCIRRGRAARSA